MQHVLSDLLHNNSALYNNTNDNNHLILKHRRPNLANDFTTWSFLNKRRQSCFQIGKTKNMYCRKPLLDLLHHH